MFIKILTKKHKGEKRYYASLVENKRINGKVVQTVKANLGPVTEEQIPYLKAAYARKKPRLRAKDEGGAGHSVSAWRLFPLALEKQILNSSVRRFISWA